MTTDARTFDVLLYTGKLIVEFHNVEGDVVVLYNKDLNLHLTPGK